MIDGVDGGADEGADEAPDGWSGTDAGTVWISEGFLGITGAVGARGRLTGAEAGTTTNGGDGGAIGGLDGGVPPVPNVPPNGGGTGIFEAGGVGGGPPDAVVVGADVFGGIESNIHTLNQ